jgi:single-strand DNA-binding protein
MTQMQGTLNQVELIGWLGNDPEHRFLTSGVGVCNFNVATKRPGGKNEAGERTIETEWTTVEAWEKLADLCASSLHKGSRVRVLGSLQTRSWEDRETGLRRFKTVVRAEQVMFLDGRNEPGVSADEEQLADVVA